MRGFDDSSIDPAACVANAARFGSREFRRMLPEAVDRAVAEARGDLPTERSARPARRARGTRPRGLGLAVAPSLPNSLGAEPEQAAGHRP